MPILSSILFSQEGEKCIHLSLEKSSEFLFGFCTGEPSLITCQVGEFHHSLKKRGFKEWGSPSKGEAGRRLFRTFTCKSPNQSDFERSKYFFSIFKVTADFFWHFLSKSSNGHHHLVNSIVIRQVVRKMSQ